MTREMEIKILMEDGCTKKEAQRHIEVGTVVFDDFEKTSTSIAWTSRAETRILKRT